jgi:hypothetical protein
MPLVQRGEIYRDSHYVYPAGNPEQKFIVVLNKDHLPSQPIIAITAHTDTARKKYNPGCNHRALIFYLRANEDFFPVDTMLQIYILCNAGFISESEFRAKKRMGAIEFRSSLRQETVGRLMKCIKELKDDVAEHLHQYLF